MKLKEEIPTTLEESGLQTKYDFADDTVNHLLALFKQWALECVGKDENVEFTELHPQERVFMRVRNEIKGQIRDRIEEATK